MTTFGKELILLSLHCSPFDTTNSPITPSSRLTTTSGSNQSVMSELCCNKNPLLQSPLPLIFLMPLSSLCSPGCFQEQASTAENHRAPAPPLNSLIQPPPLCLRSWIPPFFLR